jgi:hypothetical protein
MGLGIVGYFYTSVTMKQLAKIMRQAEWADVKLRVRVTALMRANHVKECTVTGQVSFCEIMVETIPIITVTKSCGRLDLYCNISIQVLGCF